ncbi:hypothetical protein N431DRAFT_440904 [Stipitochalara longipes BDJ]|nr:hypothetical protein N431DRAFT_440904 [Stipitochalara longipes BDJ]
MPLAWPQIHALAVEGAIYLAVLRDRSSGFPPDESEARAGDLPESAKIEQGFLHSKSTESNDDQGLIRLGDVILVHSEVNALFREYFLRFHPLFPILDLTTTPYPLHIDCPTLFWAIVTTASRIIRPGLYTALCDLVPQLISRNFFHQSYSVQPCQAMLILCMFPMPINKNCEDVRWVYSGIAMQMATLAGLHTRSSDHEYRKAGAASATERDRQEFSRTWYCCCYVNATLSAEFGLPSCIPQDALDTEDLNKAALPVDFISTIRITLESMKISRLIDLKISTNPPTDKNTTHFELLRMFESDLDFLADSMRAEEGKFGSVAEFSLLMAKLNLCSFAQADATLTTPSLSVQIYYPRAYWKGLFYACLALLKLSLTKSLPELEIAQSEIAIQQAVDLFTTCSRVAGDELYRAARLIRVLTQEAVQEIVKPRHEVKSRMGASLMYEILLSAVVWKKRKAAEQLEHSRSRPLNNKLGESTSRMDNPIFISDMSPRTMDELIASSGYLVDGMGPMGLDTSFWDTSMLDQRHVLNLSSCFLLTL